MPLNTLKQPALPSAPGTFALADTLTENYTTTASVNGGVDTKSLEVKLYWPELDDPTEPRPLVIWDTLSGWATSDIDRFDAEIEDFCIGCGVIGAAIECRVGSDDPVNPNDADKPLLYRSIMSSVYDKDAALKYILANYLEHEEFTIEPSQILFAGASAGAMESHVYCQMYPSRPVIGMFSMAAAYGGGFEITETMRSLLGVTERTHKVPTRAFLGGSDALVTSTYVDLFRDWLARSTANVVDYDPSGTHGDWTTFDESTLTDADTFEEAFYNFMLARCQATQSTATQRRNYRAWARSWPNLQSRFW